MQNVSKHEYKKKINNKLKKEADSSPALKSDESTGRITLHTLIYAASPALLYTALSSITYSVIALALPDCSAIIMQGIALLVCLAFFIWYAVRERILVRAVKKSAYRYPASFCYVSAVALCSIACNYLIVFTGLTEISAGYKHVSDIFYNNRLLIEIITLCVIGPMVEELVYRGFVYQRLRYKGGRSMAVLLSALLFGALHFNLVQGVYAFTLGLLLAYIGEQTGSLVTAAAAHMAANLASVLWTETDWLDFLNQGTMGAYGVTAVCLLLTAVFISYGNRLIRLEK